MFVLPLVSVLLGVVVGWGGLLGWREKLPRDRGAGVRTAATLRSDDAFRIANKVAGLPTITAGVVGIFAGVAGLAMPSTAGLVIATVLGLVGMVVLVVAGGLLGHRAALAVPEPAPAPAGCAGCACGGCSAVA
ncbi:MAG TPA: SdpI family protein [Amycolatopsis sp.]|nr:SdpI family protein [Amycolatopsis sp.]